MRSYLTRVKTEESFGFSVSRASEKKDILSSWGNLGQLVESEALTFSSNDSLSGFSCEFKSTYSETLGYSE